LAPESSSVNVGPLKQWGEDTDAILDSRNVSSITIQDVIITEVQLAKLGALKTATSINISNCGLSINDFNGVSKEFPVDLKFLSCTRNYLIGYPCIEHLKKLEYINFSSCRIPSQELNKLLTTLSKLPSSLRVLNISDNGPGINNNVIINLCTKLPAWTEIETFSLAKIGLTTIQSRWILSTLKSCACKKLSNIDMSNCRLKKIKDLGCYFLSFPAIQIFKPIRK